MSLPCVMALPAHLILTWMDTAGVYWGFSLWQELYWVFCFYYLRLNNIPMRPELLHPFLRWGNWDSAKLSNLLLRSQLGCQGNLLVKVRIQIQTCQEPKRWHKTFCDLFMGTLPAFFGKGSSKGHVYNLPLWQLTAPAWSPVPEEWPFIVSAGTHSLLWNNRAHLRTGCSFKITNWETCSKKTA